MANKIHAYFVYSDWLPTPYRMSLWQLIQNERDDVFRMKMELADIPKFPMDVQTYFDNKTKIENLTKEHSTLCIILACENYKILVLNQGLYSVFKNREDAYRAIYAFASKN